MKKLKFLLLFLVLAVLIISISGCSDAEVASYNLSKEADYFNIYRRVVFYNGITDTYMLSIEGFCSIFVDTVDDQLELTVKTGDNQYYKHFLGLSDNVTYFVEQLDGKGISPYHYKVIFKPSVIISDIDIR